MDTRGVRLVATADALLRLFPELEVVEPLTVLGEGFRSIVVETPEATVFRIGKNQAAAAGYARECRLLPRLQAHVSISVPNPRWFSGPTDAFPHGVMGYPRVPGRSLSPQQLSADVAADIASQLAQFLRALHRFPTSEARDVGIPRWNVREEAATWRDIVLPVLRDTLTQAEYSRVVNWWPALLSDPLLLEYESALIHRDLWYEHLLVDESMRHIVGVVDFEEAVIGDPAQDLAMQRHLDIRFANQVLAAYRAQGGRVDVTMYHRIQRLWELREFEGLQFAVRTGDIAETEDAIRKLRVGPVLEAED